MISIRNELSEEIESKNRKKTTVNLFIDEGVIDDLKEESKAKGISLNAKINMILAKYANFYRRAEEIDALFISPRQWIVFLEMLDENKTAEIMKSDGHGAIIAYFKHNKIPITKENLIKYFFQDLALWTGMCTNFRQYLDQQRYRHLIFDHAFNLKWSRIASNVFSDLMRVTLNVSTEVSILPNTFEIKIMEREFD